MLDIGGINMSIGERIKNLRKLNKLTQNELAQKSNISRSYLADIEKDRYNASLETLKSIAQSLNANISDIIEENKNTSEKESIMKELPIIPSEFTDPNEARIYISKHQIFAYGGFYPDKMSDEDILNFANEMIHQAELIGHKYKNK